MLAGDCAAFVVGVSGYSPLVSSISSVMPFFALLLGCGTQSEFLVRHLGQPPSSGPSQWRLATRQAWHATGFVGILSRKGRPQAKMHRSGNE